MATFVRMKIDIVVVYVQRYRQGHELDFVPPITGIHLAALTPPGHEVRVIHQQVQPVDLDTDADLVALSFFSGFAPEAYRLADAFRSRGKKVVAGGPHVTYAAQEALRHVDAVVLGEADAVWPTLLADAERGALQRRYQGGPHSMRGLPTPRYDLLGDRFFVPRVVQATRGCPYRCSFCTVPTLNPGFRMRPVEEVLRDIRYDDFEHAWQRKVVWFWDDNLTIHRPYAHALLRAMVPEKKWWLTQASLDIANDRALLDDLEASGCIGIFFGIESFGAESLKQANKRQNKIATYRASVERLHERGICVMAGFISGFDGDTPESILQMAENLDEIGVDVPFLSILTPFQGTPLYDELLSEGRLLEDRGWEFFNGYNVAFRPRAMTPGELLNSHRQLWRRAFSLRASAARVAKRLGRLRAGAQLMSACMNGFYALKALRGNEPVDMATRTAYRDAALPEHVRIDARPAPVKLTVPVPTSAAR
ncbi:radical SAM protein [Aggregicoccus sp. 17bor-14]|uniref:B12-binding domain-containing radical SAM protein n=1 Tax=Myxococcaceae TaxID=31 RepID=UPI00351A451D